MKAKLLTLIAIFCLASLADAAITAAQFNPRNCGTFTGSGAPLNAYSYGGFRPFWFEIQTSIVSRVTASGGTSSATVYDTVVSRESPATTVTDYLVTIVSSQWPRTNGVEVTVTSENPAILSNPVDGLMSYVSDGDVGIIATSSLVTLTNTVTCSTAIGQTIDTVTNFVAGSLTKHIRDAADALLTGKDPSTTRAIFSSVNETTTNYVRNASLWCGDLSNLACPSPWNSEAGRYKAGTLISKRHILFAAHYQIATNSAIRFIAADGSVVERTMTAKQIMPNYSPYYPDLCVGLLDSAVPDSIPFAKVLPTNWASYIPTLAQTPALSTDQNDNLNVCNITGIGPKVSFGAPTNSVRLPFYSTPVVGDSGNPIFWMINGQLVMLSAFTTPINGTSVMDQYTNINTVMTNLGVTNQLTDVDLSGFPTF